MTASARGYATASAIVFALVTVFQLCRARSGWAVEINHYAVPLAASWGIAVVTGLLAVWGWRSR